MLELPGTNTEDADADRFAAIIAGHKRKHDFSPLVPLYGSKFVQTLAGTFKAATQGKSFDRTSRSRRAIVDALSWICLRANLPEPGEIGRVYLHLRDRHPEPLDEQDFGKTISTFCGHVRDHHDVSVIESRNLATRNHLLWSLSCGLNALSERGFLPRVTIRGIRNAKLKYHTKRPILGELISSGRVNWNKEAKALQALAKHLPKDSPLRTRLIGKGGLSLHERMLAVGELNRMRWLELRDCAERELREEHAEFKRGQEFLSREDLPSAADVASLPNLHRMVQGYAPNMEPVFARIQEIMPNNDRERRLGALVRYFVSEHNGCVETSRLEYSLKVAVGSVGFENVIRCIEGTRVALIAAHTIILCDTGLNTGVCDKLKAQPFVGDAKHNRRKATLPKEVKHLKGAKMRAGGRTVDAVLDDRSRARAAKAVVEAAEASSEQTTSTFELDVKRLDGRLSGVEVIEMWQEMSGPIRERAIAQGSPDADYLWIIPGGKNNARPVALIVELTASACFNAFVKRHKDNPVIGGLPITRPMIRNTVTAIQAERGRFDAAAAQVRIDHRSPGTTMGYINTPYLRRQLAAQIREFLKIFEAGLVSEIENAAARLGIPADELAVRKELAEETGLGFLCMTPKAGLRAGTTVGETCTKIEDCAKCPSRRFVPTERALEALHVMNTALLLQQEEFEVRNPARFEAAWLPWLAMTSALIAVLKEGQYRKRFIDAAEAAQAKLDAGTIALPRLW